MRTRFLSVILLVLSAGCSHQELYEIVQDNRQQECRQLPYPQDEECLATNSESYEEYERKRKALLDSP